MFKSRDVNSPDLGCKPHSKNFAQFFFWENYLCFSLIFFFFFFRVCAWYTSNENMLLLLTIGVGDD